MATQCLDHFALENSQPYYIVPEGKTPTDTPSVVHLGLNPEASSWLPMEDETAAEATQCLHYQYMMGC